MSCTCYRDQVGWYSRRDWLRGSLPASWVFHQPYTLLMPPPSGDLSSQTARGGCLHRSQYCSAKEPCRGRTGRSARRRGCGEGVAIDEWREDTPGSNRGSSARGVANQDDTREVQLSTKYEAV